MKDRSLMIVVATLFILPSGNALAEDDTTFNGSLELGVRLADGEDEGAKFQEYRDLGSGVIGNFLLDYDTESNYLEAEAENIGYRDQFYQIKGRRYGKYKYSLFYDEIPHNLSFDAYSFYSGIGSDNLFIDVGDPRDRSTWQRIDYDVDTTSYGADIEFSLAAPFFFTVGVDRQEKDGLKPLGSGSFSGVVEMPEPVDYATNNFKLSGGYRTEDVSFKLDGIYSSFSNANNFLSWENPFLGIAEHNSLPTDNDYTKIGMNFSWRNLPLMSSLAVRGSYTNLTSDFSQDELGSRAPAGLNETTFKGDISTINLAATYASHPLDDLDTRLFYEYFDRENDSTVIEYNGGGNDIHLFDYSKHRLGFDGDYGLAPDTSISAGYTFETVDRRNRPDAESTTDNQIFVKLKNTSLDYLTAKLEYTYLNRDSDANHDLTGLTPFDSEYIVEFVQRYDVASKSKHAIEIALELYPLDNLDFGFSYTFVNNDYDDVTLGRTEDTGHEFYVDFMWRASKMLQLSGFTGYETYQADSNHYNFSPGQIAVPTFDDGNPASYRWRQSIDEDFWTLGLMAQMPLMEDRLKLSISWQYQQSDGTSDFTSEGTSTLEPIDKYDDYDINTVDVKAVYALTEMLDLSLGYLYEKSSYKDLQYLEYSYNPRGTYMSGAYADYDYEAHVGYITVKYIF